MAETTTRPIIRVHNVSTNEVVDREMNDEEYAIHLESIAIEAEKLEEEKIKLEEKTAVLDKIGLTHEEFQTIIE